VAKLKDKLTMNKQGTHTFHMERFSLKKLNEVEGKERYRFEISSKFSALEVLNAEEEINSAWEMIKEIIKSIRHCSTRDAHNY
jgi:hypothetical protein